MSVAGNGADGQDRLTPAPCRCQRCGWLGTADQTGLGAACPSCGRAVVPLGQKGLDGLRREYALLLKPDYQAPEKGRVERRFELSRFFEQLGLLLPD